MKKFVFGLATFIVLIFGGASYADKYDVPKQTIQGGDQAIPLGEMVDLSLSPIANKSPALAASDYKWLVLEACPDPTTGEIKLVPKRVREVSDGVFFGAGIKNKTLFVQCVCTYLFILKDDAGKVGEVGTRTVVVYKTIKIGDDSPNPNPPGPGPNPPSPPSFPVGKYDLSKTSYNLAYKDVSNANDRVKGAAAYAGAFSALAGKILASPGTYTLENGLKQAITDGSTALKNNQVSAVSWSSFGDGLQDALYGLYQSKKMVSSSDLAVALQEIAVGLGSVK